MQAMSNAQTVVKTQTMNIIQAVNDALRIQMRKDPRTLVMGEDVGKFGGVFRATQGLYEEFGANRAIDTPLSEGGIIGTAIGMAIYGLRPVAEIQFADYIFPAFDQIVNEAAKFRYRSGGQYTCPLVIRTPYGGGIRGGHYHSQSPEAYFIHTPGLKVIMPSNPYDAKGLLLAAMRQDDPVIYFEPKRMYRASKGEVPTDDYEIEIGKAKVTRVGEQVTLIAWGAMWHNTTEFAEKLAAENISAEVIDLRTLWPLDIDTIVNSVEKTGRAVIIHEAPRTCGFGAEISALIHERCMLKLEAPVQRVTGFDTPFPYSLEHGYMPSHSRMRAAVERTLNY